MTRRELIRLTGSSILFAGLPPTFRNLDLDFSGINVSRLFFDPEDIPRIRANAKSRLLSPLYSSWESITPADLLATFDKFDESQDVIQDFAAAINALAHTALVQIVSPTQAREAALLEGVNRLVSIQHWDYFLDGDKPIGIQRASMATEHLLFVREVLGDAIDTAMDNRILDAVAEKGCLPCFRTVQGMDDPSTVEGWQFNERHAKYYDITMDRWPTILGANNLRAAPTGAMGIGALALLGRDPRAEEWLRLAVSSSQFVLSTFSPDGSYFEGLSYSEYTLRTSLSFFEAYARNGGTVDWLQHANFKGMLDFMLSMQLGRNADGSPDIVNFSDARTSINPGAPSWIGKYTGDPVAQFVAENISLPRFFLDFLWFDEGRPSQRPSTALKNVRNDLDWIICRSGWEDNDGVVAFRSGGPCNHEHADRNHITYKVFGERLLTDQFGAAYDKRHPGWLVRLTEAHNAVLVDGKGCRYHDGNEGVNDSQSYATVTAFGEHGDTVWWTSDASPAYLLDNDHITKVLRTVIFSKPDVIVILDQVRLHFGAQPMSVHFYPDNRDGAARLDVDGNTFVISRPKASLHGTVHSRQNIDISSGRLGVPIETGDFPRIRLSSDPGFNHEIVTVLRANAQGTTGRTITVDETTSGWDIHGDNLNVRLDTSRVVPIVTVS